MRTKAETPKTEEPKVEKSKVATMDQGLRFAYASGCPLVFVRTSDQPDCVGRVVAAIGKDPDGKTRPIMVHDGTRGLVAYNQEASRVKLKGEGDSYTDPQSALDAARDGFPRDTLFVMLCADRWLPEPRPAGAAMLLRDPFKGSGRTLVCLGTSYQVASELGADVVVVDDPPPTEETRGKIVDTLAEESEVKVPAKQRAAMLTYTRGLSAFATEQCAALAIKADGFDLEVAAKCWREQIDATPGLRVLTERPSPESVAGLDGWSQHVKRLVGGRQPPEAVVFIDEIEKSLSGSSGASSDSSGASQQVLGRMLSEMESTGAQGSIFLGAPGTGKTLAATAVGVALGVPTIAFNPSDCKGSLVGDTEKNTTRALSVIRALAGRAYWIATCNGIASLPPEILRRFTDGVWFFDLPSTDELTAIWAVHLAKYGHKTKDRWPNDDGWTGADVRNVCRAAWNASVPVSEIAGTHVPSSRASTEVLDRIRRAASGNYRSAQRPGPYVYDFSQTSSRDDVASPRRRLAKKED